MMKKVRTIHGVMWNRRMYCGEDEYAEDVCDMVESNVACNFGDE